MANAWAPAVALAELLDGKPILVTADGSDLLLYRTGERILAVSNSCTHQGAPLHRGVLRESGSLLTVTCPLHGSTFELTDGRVIRGPATDRLPVFETRVSDGTVEVRLQP